MPFVAALLLAAAAPAPLPPIGKWNLDYQENSCVLAHAFGDPKKPVVLAWQAIPLTDGIEVMISERRSDDTFRNGNATISFGDQSGKGSYRSYPTTDSSKHMTLVSTDRALFVGSAAPVTATLHLLGSRSFAFTVPNGAAALASLQKCLDQTLVDWGVNPKELAEIVTPAVAAKDEAHWISEDDYPVGSSTWGRQGISILLWKVDAAGRVADCRAVVPSGAPELDKAGCNAIAKRGRYTPARNAAGMPVATYRIRKVVWSTRGGLAGP